VAHGSIGWGANLDVGVNRFSEIATAKEAFSRSKSNWNPEHTLGQSKIVLSGGESLGGPA